MDCSMGLIAFLQWHTHPISLSLSLSHALSLSLLHLSPFNLLTKYSFAHVPLGRQKDEIKYDTITFLVTVYQSQRVNIYTKKIKI